MPKFKCVGLNYETDLRNYSGNRFKKKFKKVQCTMADPTLDAAMGWGSMLRTKKA